VKEKTVEETAFTVQTMRRGISTIHMTYPTAKSGWMKNRPISPRATGQERTLVNAETKRYIGIRHRTKRTKEGEARPTEVCIVDNENPRKLILEDEQDELDFVLGRFPIKWRTAEEGEDLSNFPSHHIVEKRDKDDREKIVSRQVPSYYDGLHEHDTIGMILGGSGDYLAFALANRGKEIKASVLRLPPFKLKERRGEAGIEKDSELLATLVQNEPALFHTTHVRDLNLIRTRLAQQDRIEVMKARIACEQRLSQRIIGEIFTEDPDALFKQGQLELVMKERKANDAVLNGLVQEETKAKKAVDRALLDIPMYTKVLSQVEGCGPLIAARLVTAIGDIRRFATDTKLMAFCGVHVMPDGRFARRRGGTVSNWHPDARQALYLLADQFNRRPASKWGAYLIETKRRMREKHPIAEVVDGKKRYTDGHIHKMAIWRTLTRFVRWLWHDLDRLERGNDTVVITPKGPEDSSAE
jgi:hypothetical protein